MATHWTCATPRFHPGIERPKIFPDNKAKDDEEWNLLYNAAEKLIGTSEHEYDKSIRHNAVLRALNDAKPRLPLKNPDKVIFKPLPLACHRVHEGSPYVQWHSAENIYGDMFTEPNKKNANGVKRGFFRLLTNTRCTRLHPRSLFTLEAGSGEMDLEIAEVQDLLKARFHPDGSKAAEINFAIHAKTFIVAAGAVGTAQILASSKFGGLRDQEGAVIPNLGLRITEQPMAFCQVVLRQSIVDEIGDTGPKSRNPDWWKKAVERHREKHKKDPLPIPFHDGEPQVNIPVSEGRPWHVQIHRDAFSYGEVGPRVDPRLVVDLRYFGLQTGVKENRLLFENEISDMYGMPQATFEYMVTPEHAIEATDMMNEMTSVANALGGYLPGSNPQFMTPGLALHLGGTVRLGSDDGKESVADYTSRVWRFKNLYVGGNGVIPTPFAANPTLTSICFAIRSAYFIYNRIKNPENAPDPSSSTPPEWVGWASNPKDTNYPHPRTAHLIRAYAV